MHAEDVELDDGAVIAIADLEQMGRMPRSSFSRAWHSSSRSVVARAVREALGKRRSCTGAHPATLCLAPRRLLCDKRV